MTVGSVVDQVLLKLTGMTMNLGIKGKRALVLSAGGGLGGAIAVALAKEGALVCIAGRSEESLAATAERVQAVGGQVRTYVWDLSESEQCREGVQKILADVGGIDILINNTGGPQPGPAFGQSAENWRAAFESMVISVIGITDLLLPGMRERGWGRVITSTSSGWLRPLRILHFPMSRVPRCWGGPRPWLGTWPRMASPRMWSFLAASVRTARGSLTKRAPSAKGAMSSRSKRRAPQAFHWGATAPRTNMPMW